MNPHRRSLELPGQKTPLLKLPLVRAVVHGLVVGLVVLGLWATPPGVAAGTAAVLSTLGYYLAWLRGRVS